MIKWPIIFCDKNSKRKSIGSMLNRISLLISIAAHGGRIKLWRRVYIREATINTAKRAASHDGRGTSILQRVHLHGRLVLKLKEEFDKISIYFEIYGGQKKRIYQANDKTHTESEFERRDGTIVARLQSVVNCKLIWLTNDWLIWWRQDGIDSACMLRDYVNFIKHLIYIYKWEVDLIFFFAEQT